MSFDSLLRHHAPKKKPDLSRWQKPSGELLLDAFMSAKSQRATRLLLESVLTEREADRISRRILASLMIMKGAPYSVVGQMTRLNNDAISRLSKMLDPNEPDGLYRFLKRLKKRDTYTFFKSPWP